LRAFFSLAILAAALQAGAAPEHVSLNTGAGRLQGIRDLPEGKPPFVCALIIAGSGPTDRDGNQPALRNDSLKQLGEALARRGVCALRYDKRGIGASAAAGVPEPDLTFETLVEDAALWLRWLRREARVRRVAVIGHSEGALIALLAAKLEGVEAVVTIAGAGRPAPAVIRDQLKAAPEVLRLKSEAILGEVAAGRIVQDVPGELAALFRPSVQPYLHTWFKYDPAAAIAAIDAPVLVMHGTADLQVPVADAWLLAAGRPAVQLRLIPDMNHVLKHAVTPEEQRAAYADPSIPIEPRAVDVLVEFLLRP
jgi:uncharacterized protein